MNKLLIAFLLSAFAMTTHAADTDTQTDGAELGTNETPQAQDQSKNSRSTNTDKSMKKRHQTHKNMKYKKQNSGNSENNPLQPTEPESAPGAAQ